MTVSPWEVLGLKPGASPDAIRQAYRQMAQRHHPDKHPNDPQAQARFQEIQSAYTALSKPSAASSAASGEDFTGWGSPDDLDEIFRQVFRRASAGPSAVRRVELPLTLEQVMLGGEETFTLPTGQRVEVRWRPGIAHGQRLPLWGDRTVNGWEAVVRQIPHADYAREGADLMGRLTLSYAHLVRGGPVEVRVLGQTIRGQTPPRMVPGQRLRLAGHGLPRGDGRRGDLYLDVQLEMPSVWTDSQLKALDTLDQRLHPAPKAPKVSSRPSRKKPSPEP